MEYKEINDRFKIKVSVQRHKEMLKSDLIKSYSN